MKSCFRLNYELTIVETDYVFPTIFLCFRVALVIPAFEAESKYFKTVFEEEHLVHQISEGNARPFQIKRCIG